MGCFSSREASGPPVHGVYKEAGPKLVKRGEEHFYDISFPSRPLHITLTSSWQNIDGYITSVDLRCPVEDAQNTIVVNSKVVYVNGELVEGCDVTVIADHLQNGQLPLKLTMAHPDGLASDEVPDMEPQTVVHMEPGANDLKG